MATIISNNDNKVLKSNVDGKILKQNYNFSKGFVNAMGLSNYIKIAATLSQYGTWCFDVKQSAWDAGGTVFNYLNLKNTNNDNFSFESCYGYSTVNKNAVGDYGASNLPLITGSNNSMLNKNFQSINFNADNINYLQNKLGTIYQGTSTLPNAYQFNEIWIGATRVTSGATPSRFSSNIIAFNRFFSFSRKISQPEFLYLYNLGNGNEPLTFSGLDVFLKNNLAEILDFSVAQNGSDMRVGCRDYSGNNRHGEIINLPAGTLQQKCDYANANLFQSW